VSEIPEIRPN